MIVAAAGWWLATRPAANPIANHIITPLAVDYPYQGAPAWSPDGKSIAYEAQVDGVLQILTRPVGSTQPAQLTRRMFDCYDPFWDPDGRRVYFHSQARDKPGLWGVSAAGEPELVQPNAARATISPDGKSLVFFKQEGDLAENLTLWAAPSAVLAEARKLEVGFDKRGLGAARVRFAPDGSKFVVWAYGYLAPPHQSDHDLFWIVSWPEAVVRNVLSLGRQQRDATVEFDWFPDSRHLAISLGDRRTSGRHLWLADTKQDRAGLLTMTSGSEGSPSVSPDGSRIAFTAEDVDFDPGWNTYLNTPPIPDYASTHSALGSAAAEVLTRFFGREDIAFDMTSGAPFAGITRHFSSFSQAAQENADSRVYAGIHFRTACRDGLKLGGKIGKFTVGHLLEPLP